MCCESSVHVLQSLRCDLFRCNDTIFLASFCSERLEEEQRATEELYEKRLDILSKSVKKARKRPRLDVIEDEDDEWVSSVALHREEIKNKVLYHRHAATHCYFKRKK